MQLGALRSALSAKLRDGELRVVREFALTEPKSKLMRQALSTLEAKQDGSAGGQLRQSQSDSCRAGIWKA